MAKIIGTSGGTGPIDFAGVPPYQNGMKSARGFMTTGNANVFTTLDSSGWPTTDFQTYLIELAVFSPTPSWAHVNDAANPWKCGYTSKNGGAETISGISATISNKVVVGNAVTFDLVPTLATAGFEITGTTGGVTGVFANLPAYPTASGTFTNEYVNGLANFGCQRALDWGNALFCSAAVTAATRHTPSNCHSKAWATSSTTTNINGTNVPTPDGYSFEDWVILCNQTSADCWWNFPLNCDSTYISAIGAYAAANLTGRMLPELDNENWNGVGVGGMGGFNEAVASYILANSGKLDYDAACSFSGTANGTNVISGTIPATAATGHVIVGPSVPTGTTITAVTTGAGGSITCSNVVTTGSGTFAFETFNTRFRYTAERLYQIALLLQSAYGASFSSKVKIAMAWQSGGNGLSMFNQAFAYLAHTYSATQVNTVLGALSTAPYENRNNTNVPGDGIDHIGETGDSVGTIQSQLISNATYQPFFSLVENTAITAMNRGLEYFPYECGWDTSTGGGESAATNIGLAIMDSGFTSVVETYLQTLFNSGASGANWTAWGVTQTSAGPGLDPNFGLAVNYDTFEASGSPRLAGIQNVNTNGVSYTRNVVSGSGSVIDCINYADNVALLSATYPHFGQLNSFSQGPYYSVGGYIGYIVNCTKAGFYQVTGTFDTTAPGTTNFEWGNPISPASITTGIAIGNGTGTQVILGNLTLAKGPNYILLGNGTTQSAIVPKRLTFNSMSTPTLVQHVQGTAQPATTVAATLSGVVGGNGVIIVLACNSGAPVLNSIVDSSGNTVLTAVAIAGQSSHASLGVYYVQNAASGAHTVTATWSTSNFAVMFMAEYSGLATSGMLDVASALAFAASTSITSPSIIPAANGELLIFAIAQQQATNTFSSFTNSFVQEDETTGSISASATWAAQVQAVATSINGGATSTTTDGSAAAIVAFVPASSPPPSTANGNTGRRRFGVRTIANL